MQGIGEELLRGHTAGANCCLLKKQPVEVSMPAVLLSTVKEIRAEGPVEGLPDLPDFLDGGGHRG